MADPTDWDSGVLPHGDLEQLAPNVWQLTGSLPGMPLPRNMVVVRLADGTLLIHSAVAANAEVMAKIEALGRPSILVVPNEGHRLDAPRYKKRYPDVVVVGPANVRDTIEKVIQLDKTCEEALPPLGIKLHKPDGMKDGYEYVYEVDLEGGGRALLVNDVLAGPTRAKGLLAPLMRLVGTPGGGFGLPRIVRFFFLKDKERYRAWLRDSLAAIPDVRLLTVGHGPALTTGVAEAIRAAADTV